MAEENQDKAPQPGELVEAFNPCREVSQTAIEAFTNLLRETAENGVVEMDTVERIANAVLEGAGPLSIHYQNAFSKCQLFHEELGQRQRRSAMLSRVIVEPFAHLLDDDASGISRQILTQFRAALRMILGDPVIEKLGAICREAAEECGLPLGGEEKWQIFYADQRSIDVRDRVLIAIAASFKRFDTRLEWFLTLMSTDHETESLGSHAFISRGRDNEHPFSFRHNQFHTLLTALYARQAE